MPGAGSNKAAGYIYSVAPKDGTAIAAVYPGGILDPLIGELQGQHDPRKINYLGSANSDVYICIMRSDAPAKRFEDVFGHEVIVGGSNSGGTTKDLSAMLNNLLGAKFRVVTGYAGSKEITLAMERNEVNGNCGIGWTGLPVMHPDWFAQKLMNVIVQISMTGHPELNAMGVPLAVQFAKSDEDRRVMELIESQGCSGGLFCCRPKCLPGGSLCCAKPSSRRCAAQRWPPRLPGCSSISIRCPVRIFRRWSRSFMPCRRLSSPAPGRPSSTRRRDERLGLTARSAGQ